MAASSHHSFIDKDISCGSLQTSIRAPGHYIHCQSQQLMLEGYYYFQSQFLIQMLPTIPSLCITWHLLSGRFHISSIHYTYTHISQNHDKTRICGARFSRPIIFSINVFFILLGIHAVEENHPNILHVFANSLVPY